MRKILARRGATSTFGESKVPTVMHAKTDTKGSKMKWLVVATAHYLGADVTVNLRRALKKGGDGNTTYTKSGAKLDMWEFCNVEQMTRDTVIPAVEKATAWKAKTCRTWGRCPMPKSWNSRRNPAERRSVAPFRVGKVT